MVGRIKVIRGKNRLTFATANNRDYLVRENGFVEGELISFTPKKSEKGWRAECCQHWRVNSERI